MGIVWLLNIILIISLYKYHILGQIFRRWESSNDLKYLDFFQRHLITNTLLYENFIYNLLPSFEAIHHMFDTS